MSRVIAKNPTRRSWLDSGDGNSGWLPHRLDLMVSPSWHLRPIPVIRLLERIEIEHLRHGGKENGNLCVSYAQLVEHGVSRKVIKAAVETAVGLGLLKVIQNPEWVGNIREPNIYELTYVPRRGRRAPTDEWSSIDEATARKIAASFAETSAQKSHSQLPKPPDPSALSGQAGGSPGSLSGQTPVTSREPSIIFGGKPAAPAGGARGVVVARPAEAGVSEDDQAGGFTSVGAALASALPSIARRPA